MAALPFQKHAKETHEMKNRIKLITLSLCLSIIGCILFSPAEATLLREPTKAEAMISNYQESVHHSNQTYCTLSSGAKHFARTFYFYEYSYFC